MLLVHRNAKPAVILVSCCLANSDLNRQSAWSESFSNQYEATKHAKAEYLGRPKAAWSTKAL